MCGTWMSTAMTPQNGRTTYIFLSNGFSVDFLQLMIGADNLHRGPVKSFFQHFTGIEDRYRLDRPRRQSRPARLMAGADARAIVAVEIFVEENQITPMRIVLELGCAPVHRAPSGFIA